MASSRQVEAAGSAAVAAATDRSQEQARPHHHHENHPHHHHQHHSNDLNVHYRVYYFPIRGRAEVIRWILEYVGAKYENQFTKNWAAEKPTTPFGQLPVLVICEQGEETHLAQSSTIVRYLARRYGLMPRDQRQAALLDTFFESWVDLALRMVFVAWETPSASERKRALDDIRENVMPSFITAHTRRLAQYGSQGSYCTGEFLHPHANDNNSSSSNAIDSGFGRVQNGGQAAAQPSSEATTARSTTAGASSASASPPLTYVDIAAAVFMDYVNEMANYCDPSSPPLLSATTAPDVAKVHARVRAVPALHQYRQSNQYLPEHRPDNVLDEIKALFGSKLNMEDPPYAASSHDAANRERYDPHTSSARKKEGAAAVVVPTAAVAAAAAAPHPHVAHPHPQSQSELEALAARPAGPTNAHAALPHPPGTTQREGGNQHLGTAAASHAAGAHHYPDGASGRTGDHHSGAAAAAAAAPHAAGAHHYPDGASGRTGDHHLGAAAAAAAAPHAAGALHYPDGTRRASTDQHTTDALHAGASHHGSASHPSNAARRDGDQHAAAGAPLPSSSHYQATAPSGGTGTASSHTASSHHAAQAYPSAFSSSSVTEELGTTPRGLAEGATRAALGTGGTVDSKQQPTAYPTPSHSSSSSTHAHHSATQQPAAATSSAGGGNTSGARHGQQI